MRRQQARAERNADENEARAALRRRLNEAEETVSRRDGRKESIPKPSRPIQAGDLVEIPGVRTPAEVVSVGKDGTLQLKSGILKMKAQASEVRLIEEDERAARKKAPAAIRQSAGQALRAAAARELDIRGLETLEAEAVVENFLSAAVMGKLVWFFPAIFMAKISRTTAAAVSSMISRPLCSLSLKYPYTGKLPM